MKKQTTQVLVFNAFDNDFIHDYNIEEKGFKTTMKTTDIEGWTDLYRDKVVLECNETLDQYIIKGLRNVDKLVLEYDQALELQILLRTIDESTFKLIREGEEVG